MSAIQPGLRPLPSNRRVVTPPRANVPITPKNPWDPDALWRHLRLAGRIALGVAIVACGVLAAVYARRYVTQSPRFALKDLRIEGNHHRTREQIVALAGIALGQNVVELDLEAVRARLERDPWIERATIMRRLPASVAIDVIERDAGAIVALPSGTWLATARGDLFKKIEADDPNDLPVLTGITDDAAASDRDATAQIIRRALDLAADAERVGLFGGRVQELAVDADGGITAVLSRGKHSVRVVFGKSGYRQKVRLGARVEAELARRGGRPTTVFLDDDVHPDRIVVRLVSALPPAEVTVDGATP
jgi:cell division protein FtsQ